MSMKKRGLLMQKTVVHLIIIAIVTTLFLFATVGKVDSAVIRQDVLKKQIALLIESSPADTIIEMRKQNINGEIKDIKIENNNICVSLIKDQFDCHPFFSKYKVEVIDNEDRFSININEK